MTKTLESPIETRLCPDCDCPMGQTTKRQSFLHGTASDEVELTAEVPIWHCPSCDFESAGGGAEELRHEAVCRHFRLLTPREIRCLREAHGLSQAQFAAATGIGLASIKRWETGALLQNVAADNLLRLIANDAHALEKLQANALSRSG